MNSIYPLIEETKRRATEEITQACARTLDLVSSYPEIAEILKEILWADNNILSSVFGWINEDKSGWYANWGLGISGICDRIQFANQFAGYEILDDGDPGIAYCRYFSPLDEEFQGLYGMRVCSKESEGAEPFITSSRETFCEQSNWIPSICNEKSVLAVFRFHEAQELKHRKYALERTRESAGQSDNVEVSTETKLIRQWMSDSCIIPKSKQTTKDLGR